MKNKIKIVVKKKLSLMKKEGRERSRLG